ncbi:MAG: transposase [Verrucomicrobiota bacterium]
MCDPLEHNQPPGQATDLRHCLVQARRQIVEIRTSFPDPCRRVVAALAGVYRMEARCREQQADDPERRRRHQAHSQPVLEEMRRWLQESMDQKQVEPNSGLGKAIGYVLGRWETPTRFLRVTGAPLDNKVTEQLLKSSILHRRNSLHYQAQRGAAVGDTFMALIEPCRANEVIPFDQLLAVARNPDAVRADPGRWLPWNHSEALPTPAAPPPPTQA